jgi:hypothetical protein
MKLSRNDDEFILLKLRNATKHISGVPSFSDVISGIGALNISK